jgi:Kef-type K+ transport system membrane component KefB/mannitol/fructose-specific phosphotransferase system IIA component (Ntr-type)/nucleotide-binding universal stress UspA family protein
VTGPTQIVAVAMLLFLLAPLLMQRLRVPGIVGLIVAGAVVGPHALNLLARDQTIVLLGTVGLLYLMFMAGVEIDLHGFSRYRNRSLVFGALTFLIPQTFGTGVGRLLGYDWPTSILLASMFASHTLVAYPIATRFGIAKNGAVTTAVGGTIITDTAALLVLAVIAASTRGTLDALFWLRLVVFLALYLVLVLRALPRLGRWFFRRGRSGGTAEYVFILAALFTGAWGAEVAGVEAIVGAFLVGLALNRLIPEQGLLTNRIHFVGEAIFIPFFLLSVGMLVDVRVLAGSARAWQVMLAMTATVMLTKWLAARASQALFRLSPEEGWVMFGLSVPQAAATLAATLIGFEVGLFDDAVLNGSILMILVTCIAGPAVVERYGRRLALQEERKPLDPDAAPQRILVPMANPATADALLDLALMIREAGSAEPLFPLTVVPDEEERSAENVALAEKMLSHAVAYAAGADVPVVPLTRVDHNFASGIARAATETRTSTLILGWDGKRSRSTGIFGSVLDQLLEETRQQVLVAKLGHPLNTTERLVVVVPRGSDRVPGFPETAALVKRMANRLGASILGVVVEGPRERYLEHFERIKPDASTHFERAPGWPEALGMLRERLRRDDLVMVLSARSGGISWHPVLDRLPGELARSTPESFLLVYPSEARPSRTELPVRAPVPAGLLPGHVLLNLSRRPYPEVIRTLLATAFPSGSPGIGRIARELERRERDTTTEIVPGVVVPHARVDGLAEPMMFVGTCPEGILFPGAEAPARLIFLLLTPGDRPDEHLHALAKIARLVSDPERVREMVKSRSPEELLGVLPTT